MLDHHHAVNPVAQSVGSFSKASAGYRPQMTIPQDPTPIEPQPEPNPPSPIPDPGPSARWLTAATGQQTLRMPRYWEYPRSLPGG
jgi:hypothetical protein